MKKLIYIILIIAFAGVVSCTKHDIDPPISNSPVFALAATGDFGNINIKAGDDTFRMLTNYALSNDDVWEFSGNLLKNCDSGDCDQINYQNEGLYVSFRDNIDNHNINSNFDITDILKIKNYNFEKKDSNNIQTLYKKTIHLSMTPSNIPYSYTVDWGDGLIDSNTNIHNYLDFNPHTIKVNTTQSTNNCLTYNEIQLGNDPACTVWLKLIYNPGSLPTLEVIGNANTLFSVIWKKNGISIDSSLVNNNILSIPFQDTSSAALYTAEITNSNGCTTVASKRIYYNANGIYSNNCDLTLKDSLSETIIINELDKQFSTVRMVYRDAGGTIWKTNEANQDTSAYFEVTNIENYDSDPINNNRTQKITFNFKATFWNQSNAKIMQGQATLAIGFP